MTTLTLAPKRPIWMTLLHRIPLIGTLIKDAGRDDNAQFFFALNIILIWASAGFTFGIAGILAIAYLLVPTVFITLLGIMLFSGR